LKIFFTRYMNLAQLFDSVFYVYKKSFAYQIMFVLLTQTIYAAVAFAASVAIVLYSGLTGGAVSLFTVFLPALPFLLVLVVAYAFGVSGNIALTYQVRAGGRVRASEALSLAARSIPRVSCVILLQFAAKTPAIALLVLNVTLSFQRPEAFFLSDEYILSALESLLTPYNLFWVLVALANFVIIDTSFIAAVPAAVFERKGPLAAVKKSCALVRKDYWKLFAAGFLWLATLWAVQRSLLTISDLVIVLVGLLNDSASLTFSASYFTVLYGSIGITAVVVTLVAPLGGIFPGMVYFNQRIKHEALETEISPEQLDYQGGPDHVF
jgi:hypothetical protein